MATATEKRNVNKRIQAGRGNRKETAEGKKRTAGKTTKPLLTEKKVCNRLKALFKKEGVELFRMSSGMANMGGRFVRFGKKGIADFFTLDYFGCIIWIECKAQGKLPGPEQIEFIKERISLCQSYFCWDGVFLYIFTEDDDTDNNEDLYVFKYYKTAYGLKIYRISPPKDKFFSLIGFE